MIQRARQLRSSLTHAESILWQRLRGNALRGCRFRRQHPIGLFIADFFCPEHKLVIELDGPIHASSTKYDAERRQWLEEHKDYTVIRFTNDEVEQDIEAVLKRILHHLARPPL